MKKISFTDEQVATKIEDWIDYYNNERYQWKLAKLSPNEFYEYIKTSIYLLDVCPCPKIYIYGQE